MDNKYTAKDGFIWKLKDGDILGKTLYLGVNDDIDRYEQVEEITQSDTEREQHYDD